MEKFNFIDKEDRPWGRFYVIHDQTNYKIKRIEVELNTNFHINFIIKGQRHGQ